jgi:hypothetical protein
MKNGNAKQVRYYTEKEYAKMYNAEAGVDATSTLRTPKEVLGFKNGYITIFKGDTYSCLEWFRSSEARYAKPWGWYFTSETNVPEVLPAGITPLRLTWEEVSLGENLKSEDTVRSYVESLIYDADPSNYVGEVGERITFTAEVTGAYAVANNFGGSKTLHTFKDSDNNVYVWTTETRCLPVGNTYEIRGTIKGHKTYKNQKQTILTRCACQPIG